MARAAGAFSVGIPGGFPNRGALAASGPDLMAATSARPSSALVEMGGSGRLTG